MEDSSLIENGIEMPMIKICDELNEKESKETRAEFRERILREAMEILGEDESFRPTTSPFLTKLYSRSNSDNSEIENHKKQRDCEIQLKKAKSQSQSTSSDFSYSDNLTSSISDHRLQFPHPPGSRNLSNVITRLHSNPPKTVSSNRVLCSGTLHMQNPSKDEITSVSYALEESINSKLTSVKTETSGRESEVPSVKSSALSSIKTDLKSKATTTTNGIGRNNGLDHESYTETITTSPSTESESELSRTESVQSSLNQSKIESKSIRASSKISLFKSNMFTESNQLTKTLQSIESGSISCETEQSVEQSSKMSRVSGIPSKKTKHKNILKQNDNSKPKLICKSIFSISNDSESIGHKVMLNTSSVQSKGSGDSSSFLLASHEVQSIKELSSHAHAHMQNDDAEEASYPTNDAETTQQSYSDEEFLSDSEDLSNLLPKETAGVKSSIETSSNEEKKARRLKKEKEHITVEPTTRLPAFETKRRTKIKTSETSDKGHNKLLPHQNYLPHSFLGKPSTSQRARRSMNRELKELPTEVSDLVHVCVEANDEIYLHAMQFAEQLMEENSLKRKLQSKNKKPQHRHELKIPHKFHHHYYY